MPDKARYQAMRRIEAQKIGAIDGMTSDFLDRLAASLKKLNRNIAVITKDLELQRGNIKANEMNLTRAMSARAQVEEILLEAGYLDNVEKLISSYDELAALSAKQLSAGGVDTRFTQGDVRALTAIKDMDFRRWDNFGNDLTEAVQRSIVESVVAGAPYADMVERLEGALLGVGEKESLFESRARTIANTYVQAFDRTITTRQSKAAGITTYVYLGPDDDVTRPFCKDILDGKEVWTEDEIEKLDNGQGLPVMQFGGGWQCRHSWRPIVVEEREEIPA